MFPAKRVKIRKLFENTASLSYHTHSLFYYSGNHGISVAKYWYQYQISKWTNEKSSELLNNLSNAWTAAEKEFLISPYFVDGSIKYQYDLMTQKQYLKTTTIIVSWEVKLTKMIHYHRTSFKMNKNRKTTIFLITCISNLFSYFKRKCI